MNSTHGCQHLLAEYKFLGFITYMDRLTVDCCLNMLQLHFKQVVALVCCGREEMRWLRKPGGIEVCGEQKSWMAIFVATAVAKKFGV